MKVLYDISWLGCTNQRPGGPTGLDRTIERLACELVQSNECELTFCAADSYGAAIGALDYLKAHQELREIPFVHRRADAAYHERAHQLMASIEKSSNRTISQRATRRVVHDAFRTLARFRGPLPAEAVLRHDIYHSPFLPIPPEVRRHSRMKAFLTCYDLIPLHEPELCAEGAPELLQATLNSIRREDFILCISQATKDDLCQHLKWLDPERVLVTHLGADERFRQVTDAGELEKVRKKYLLPAGRYLLTLGALQPRKGMEHAIACFRQLAADPGCDLSLVIAGPKGWKYEEILRDATRDSEVAQRIIFTGRVDDEDLPALYSGATAFAFPSLYEGFGLPALEAMQCGTPVIASNTTSLPEVVGDAGILVAPRNCDDLCSAILAISEDEQYATELSEKALARAAQFSWKRCAAETIAAYELALQETSAAP